MRRLGFRRPINWIFNPTAAIIAGELNEEMLIYYCVDEYAAFSGVPARALAELENRLLRRADLVVVSSEQLYQSKSPRNPHTVLVRHGVDFQHFRKALAAETLLPEDVARLPRPILGYFGLMAADWVDVDLLAEVARRYRHGSLVLLGKSVMDLAALRRLQNVHVLGHKPYEQLPAYCKAFDLGLVPFPRNEATRHANPLKVREYLAAGLPVVSTPVPEVEALGCCYIGDTADSFCAAIEAALAASDSRQLRSEGVRQESWENRLEELRRHITDLEPARFESVTRTNHVDLDYHRPAPEGAVVLRERQPHRAAESPVHGRNSGDGAVPLHAMGAALASGPSGNGV
jgi:glycosyltransferase involved in cell wall biosynthesis